MDISASQALHAYHMYKYAFSFLHCIKVQNNKYLSMHLISFDDKDNISNGHHQDLEINKMHNLLITRQTTLKQEQVEPSTYWQGKQL